MYTKKKKKISNSSNTREKIKYKNAFFCSLFFSEEGEEGALTLFHVYTSYEPTI